ncbi:AbrB family transcriptional regulator [Agrobacterium rubi]|uniref:type II toxin-antitoxin system PrlF family antitoxin n=1 Tax=Agrobacterium rubi TaxID=28099 RepID=UPI0015716787|nr:type II toxin-antitoxin system PrlF family antitoxin [Agrobacterium rubi]NTF06797.1 AbrB family transcriptional regulator [Agrobacterium rubi]NTF19039.1 AbrB family transcriptional regulator [Agrobacterium rubi]NTF26002.1 AbrB family transcriptional regulator [Agrobacterium rubi]
MPALLKKVSTITEKGQVTVPKSVRDALGLGYGGRIAFYIDENRHVSIEKEIEDEDDPVVDGFLTFLSKDMEKHPDHIMEFPDALRQRMMELTEGMQVDVDEPITGDVAL